MRNWTIFRKIEGYENYEISIDGDVRNRKTKRIIKPCYDKDGYLTIGLNKNGVKKIYKVHRLVGKAFIPNKKKLPQINHKDESKDNNYIGNLEWCTHRYNSTYGTVIQRREATKRRNKKLAKARMLTNTEKFTSIKEG